MPEFTKIREYTNRSADALKVQIIEVGNKRYLDIRKYYMYGSSYKPTRKGLMLNAEQFEMMFKVLQDHQGSIRARLGE